MYQNVCISNKRLFFPIVRLGDTAKYNTSVFVDNCVLINISYVQC